MGPCVGHAIFLFPPAPLSAAPTLNQLRLLGFSFLNSFSLGLAFSDVLSFSLQVIMGHNQMQMVWERARDGGLSLHKFRRAVGFYQFELLLKLTTLGLLVFWALTVLGAPGDGGLSLHKFRSVVGLYQFELDAPQMKGLSLNHINLDDFAGSSPKS